MRRILLICCMMLPVIAFSQTTVCRNSIIAYSNFDTPPGFQSSNWIVVGGTLINPTTNNTSVQWTGSGPGSLKRSINFVFMGQNQNTVSNVASVNIIDVPAAPNNPFVQSYNCNSAVLSFSGSPGSGNTWYWQTSPGDTQTSNSASTWTVGAPATYYLRANNNCGWSSAVSVSTAGGWLTSPPPPSVSQDPACSSFGTAPITFRSSSTSDRWYNAPSGGSILAVSNTFQISRGDGGTYYVESVSGAGCPSASRTAISASFLSCQEVCVGTTVQYTDPTTYPFTILTSNWTVTGGTITADFGSSVNVQWTTAGPGTVRRAITYFFSGQNGSSVQSIANVYEETLPPVPNAPTVLSYGCGSAVLTVTGSPPAGDPPSNVTTWYWQSVSGGTSTSVTGSSWTISSPGVYYLRSKNNCGWGPEVSVSAISGWKTPPAAPVVTQDDVCSSYGPSVATFHSSNTTDKWYTAPSGGTLVNTGNTYSIPKTDAATYYVEATANGCVSSRTAISVTLRSCSPVCQGQSTHYVATSYPSLQILSYNWIALNGTKQNTTEFTTDVLWSAVGIGRIRKDFTYTSASDPTHTVYTATILDQWVYVAKPALVPNAPSIFSISCGSVVLTMNGTPPVGDPPSNVTHWYWQTDVNGTSEANGSTQWTVTSPAVYFLRAKNDCGWSVAVSISTIPVWEQVPNDPVVTQDPACSQFDSVITFHSTSTTDRWYINNPATPAFTGNSFQINISDLSTFSGSVEAISANGCLSNRVPIQPYVPYCNVVCTNQPTPYYDNQTYDGVVTSSSWQAVGGVVDGTGTSVSVTWTTPGSGVLKRTVNYTYLGQPLTQIVLIDVIYARNCIYQPRITTMVITSPGFTQENTLDALDLDNNDAQTNYLDGLGRAQQNIFIGKSPGRKDMIDYLQYDNVGRSNRSNLPYAAQTTDGYFHDNAASEQAVFYQNTSKVASSSAPYSVRLFDQSPLNLPLKDGGAGTAWQPVDTNPLSTADNTIKRRYEINGASEVHIFNYDPLTANITHAGFYAQSQLTAKYRINEKNNTTIEYADKLGRLICKMVQYKNDETSGAKLFASTYYIYDDYGNLVVVLPPEAVRRILR